MTDQSSSQLTKEALARARLRHMRARPVHPGPALIGRTSQRLVRKALPKRGSTLGRLQLEWPDIVNAQLARLCRPEKLGHTNGGRVLTLKVLPAAAGLVQHQAETIRQRVSVAAGGDIVAIKTIQGYFRDRDQKSHRKKLHLPFEQEKKLAEKARTIKDGSLRTAILALGHAVLTPDRDTEKPPRREMR